MTPKESLNKPGPAQYSHIRNETANDHEKVQAKYDKTRVVRGSTYQILKPMARSILYNRKLSQYQMPAGWDGNDDIVGELNNRLSHQEIILNPLAEIKKSFDYRLASEQLCPPDNSNGSVHKPVPKLGGSQALGIEHQRPGGSAVGIAGLGSLMGFSG